MLGLHEGVINCFCRVNVKSKKKNAKNKKIRNKLKISQFLLNYLETIQGTF